MSEADADPPSDASASHDAGHGHASVAEPLGPIDLRAWAMAIGGGAVGVLVAVVMFAATQS